MNRQGPNGISWTDYTVNPVRYRDRATGKDVWFCVHASPGCTRCYAEALGHRMGGPAFEAPNLAKVEPYLCEKTLAQVLRFKPHAEIGCPGRYHHAGKPCPGMYKNNRLRPAVFWCDMTDWGATWVPDEWRDRILAVCALRPDVDHMFLTKRAKEVREYVTHARGDVLGEAVTNSDLHVNDRVLHEATNFAWSGTPLSERAFQWPLPNVYLGVSVEDQKRADERMDELAALAAVGWTTYVSYEPALSGIDFRPWLMRLGAHGWEPRPDRPTLIIFGGESGGTKDLPARPCDIAWGRSTRDQCRVAGVLCHIKQMGRHSVGPSPIHPGQIVRYCYSSSHGSDMEEWPTDIRVRQMPGMVT